MAIPEAFMCPITLTMMTNPYIDTEGNTYEKEAIEEWIKGHHNSPITRTPLELESLKPNRSLKRAIDDFLEELNRVNTNIISINTQNQITEEANIIMIIDVSISMNENCSNKNATEVMNYTRLDIAKQAMRTLIHSVSSSISVGLVKFNNNATQLTGLIPVNEHNKQILLEKIDELNAEGGTNIWDALRVSINLAQTIKNKKVNLMLFTDGESNSDPPRGIIPTLTDYLGNYPELNLSLNTYGFGYNINSHLLYDISNIKGGIFGFIPDSSMIGSVFVNSLAYIITNNIITLNQIEILICDKLIESLNKQNILEFNEFLKKMKEDDTTLHTKLLDDILIDCEDTQNESNGQIFKALLPQYYNKWGKHYIRSVLSAYTNKFCLNFKDHGVQNFKTESFDKIQKLIENIFISLPPPVPTGYNHNNYGYNQNGGINSSPTSQVFSSTFYNPSGVCFLEHTTVRIEGGKYITVQNVKPGMKLEALGKISTVLCVLKTKIIKGSEICLFTLDPLIGITPYHPIFYGNNEHKWVFPIESNKFLKDIIIEDSYVYNFVLDSNHIVDLDENIYAATLNHGMSGDVIEHEYFGTDKIIEDLKKHPGWINGYIQLDDYKFLRNQDNNRISGLVF